MKLFATSRRYCCTLIASIICASVSTAAPLAIDLSGKWFFKLDPGDVGIAEEWFKKDLPNTINLPGSLQEQGYGNDVAVNTPWVADSSGVGPLTAAEMGQNQTTSVTKKYPSWFFHPMYEKYRQKNNIRYPYWLQPDKHYVGAAWYQKQIDIPETWKGGRVTLILERCHWQSEVWMDGRQVGSNDSLMTPHVYDLTGFINSARHKLTVRIDNSMIYDVGTNSHIVSDHTQSAWNGVIGKIELISRPMLWINDVQVYPNIKDKSAVIKIEICKDSTEDIEINLNLSAENYSSATNSVPEAVAGKEKIKNPKQVVSITYPMGKDVQLWDEFNPALYNLKVQLTANEIGSSKEVVFGMREVRVEGTEISINGRPVFLRGTVECCIFPKTGYPPTDVASWRRVMKINKEYGLNHLRFHSWCPPEAAFTAADQEGIYVEVSCFWLKVRDEPSYQYLRREIRRVLNEYGNHPSFVLFSPGQECWIEPASILDMLKEWKTDSRRLYSGPGNSNWLLKPWLTKQYDFYAARIIDGHRTRYQTGWPPAEDGSFFTSMPPQTVIDYEEAVKAFGRPIIGYEAVQRCSYPDLNNQSKYTGSFDAACLDIAKDQLQERGMLFQAGDFVKASGLWQVEQFKEEIEAALRTKGLAGFQLLGLQDFPGQGAALVGVVDAFWDNKGYISSEEFRRFCDSTVPLARMQKRVWNSTEDFCAEVEVAHFGVKPLSDMVTICRVIAEDGEVYNMTELPKTGVPIGNGCKLGSYKLPLENIKSPGKYCFEVELSPGGIKNSWDFWVYPADISLPRTDGLWITKTFDDETVKHLESGAKVLLVPDKNTLAGEMPQCFSSIYWNCPWTSGGESQTMGILCDPRHPLFSSFPTEFYTDWQWYELLVNTRPLILDEWNRRNPWPKDYRPLIQMIDDWNLNRKLSVVAEARLGKGKLLICTLDIETGLDSRIVARQFRHSLVNYMNSESFNPQTVLTVEQIKSVFKE